ncbi:MAG: hypothetical protein ABIQ95_12355 [Bdellovibrionia bacterium]
MRWITLANVLILLGGSFLEPSAYASNCKDTSHVPFSTSDFPIKYPDSIKDSVKLIESMGGVGPFQSVSEACASMPNYLNRMKNLENAVAETAAKSTEALESIRKVNSKLFDWITHIAKIQVGENKALVEIEVDKILIEIFGNCKRKQPGCSGSDPKAIRSAFKEGNLREQFYLSWNPAIKLITKYFYCTGGRSKNCVCQKDSTSASMIYYKEHIQESGVQSMVQLCIDLDEGENPLERGRFARANEFFREEKASPTKSPARSGIDIIPLSIREQSIHESEPKAWYAGSNIFQPVPRENLNAHHQNFPDPEHLYYKISKTFGFSNVVAMSGSTDSLLNLACILGVKDENSSLLVAALGYMIPHFHHSDYEILVGARSFVGLEKIPLNSDYYKYISHDLKFASEVEKNYRNVSHEKLPTEIYGECLKGYLQTLKQFRANESHFLKAYSHKNQLIEGVPHSPFELFDVKVKEGF